MAWVRAITLMVHYLQNISMPMSNLQNKDDIMIHSAENEILQNTGVKKTLSAKGPINAKDINSEQSGAIDRTNGTEKDLEKGDSKQDNASFPNRVENHHCSKDGWVIQDMEAKEGFIATRWTNVREMLSGLLGISCNLAGQANASVTIGPQHELNRDLNHEEHEPTEVQDNLHGLSVFDESEDDDEPITSQLEIEDEHQVNMFLQDCQDSLQGENNGNIENVASLIPMVPGILQWNHLYPDLSEEALAPNAPVHVQAPQEPLGANEEAPVPDPWLVAQGNHGNQPARTVQLNSAQEYPGNQELNDGVDAAQGVLQAPEAVQVNENGEQVDENGAPANNGVHDHVPAQEGVLPPPPCPLLHPPQAKQHRLLGFDESEEEDDEPIVNHLEIEDEDQVELFLQDGQDALHGENNGNMEDIAPDVPMLPGNLQWNNFIPAYLDEAPGPNAPVQLLPFWVLQYQAYQAHVHAQAQAPQEPLGANEEAPDNAPVPDPWLEAQGNHGNQLAQANQLNAAQENEGNQEMNDGADVAQEAPQAPEAVQVNDNEQVDEDGAPANGGFHDHVPAQEFMLPPPPPPPLHPPQAMQHGPQHLHANGARGRLVAAARCLRRKLRRGNHGNHPHGRLMYIPGGQREERLPLGLEEAPPVLGGYVIAPDDEERRSRWFSRCFPFVYHRWSATAQQYPLQSDEAPEFEEVAGVVQEVNEDVVGEAA